MTRPVSTALHLVLGLSIVALIQAPANAQAKKSEKDRAAKLVLDSARRSYSSSQFDAAAARFAEFITRYPKRAEVPAASYGKGLSLLNIGTLKSLAGATTAFSQASGRIDFADRPLAMYYHGVSLRRLADATMATKPTGSDNRASYARTYRLEAVKQFTGAVDAFVARSRKAAPTTAPAVHPDIVWAARARADQCDMLLRTAQYKQAIVLANSVLADKSSGKQFADRALYCIGYACFSMKDYLNSGRALSRLAPFKQTFGPHGRYLLARGRHLSGDIPQSSAIYKAVLDDYNARKTAAIAASRSSYRSLTPAQRTAAAALVAGVQEPYVIRTIFYSALGLAESERFGNALAGFGAFVTQYPKHALAPEAQMRLGYCHMQLKSYAEAIKALDPMRKHPRHTERAQWWIARSRVGAANPEEPQKYAAALTTAIAELKAAAKSAHDSGRTNSRAYVVERDIMIELGDVQVLAGLYKDAVTTYSGASQYNSDRREEATQRLATAYHLAGDYSRSETTCAGFQKSYPKSTLLPAIWFTSAENALMSAVHYRRTGYSRPKAEMDQMYKNAVNKYQRLLDKFPDFNEAYLARYGLATAQYRLGWYNEAMATLASIPAADHSGKLAAVPYLIADCHIRTFPKKTDNALDAGKLMKQAKTAAKLLASFASGNAKSPKAPDALLKLGYCYQRLGSVLADDKAATQAYTNGKLAYALLVKNYPKDPLEPTARLEMAKCMVLLGDSKSAINELDRFQRDPYRTKPVAPLAIVQLSSLLRAGNRAIDAVRISKECLAMDKRTSSRTTVRTEWFVPLRYEYGLAIMETGEFAEANAVFSDLVKKYPRTPEGVNSLWRSGQCQRRHLQALVVAASKAGGANDEINKSLTRAHTGLVTMVSQLTAQAKKLPAGSQANLRLIYEAAWCCRILGQREFRSASARIGKDARAMALVRKSSQTVGGLDTSKAASPAVSPRNVPVQESEADAMKLLQQVIALAPQSAIAARSRFELAEMLAYRRQHNQATELLETILENSPPEDLAQKARLRLAACLLDRGDAKRAATLIKLVATKAKGEQLGHVHYLTGEVYILQKEWSKAVEQLKAFRDTEPFRRMSIADRGLIRLSHAYQQMSNWSESRRACDTIVSYMSKSPWVNEARFGQGWAYENAKDPANAILKYATVTANSISETAAKAQLRIGYCYAIQKKYAEAARSFLAIPMTYNYPEISVEAWYKAGAAQVAMKQPAQAAVSWKQLIKTYPDSKWAKQAAAQLSQLPVTKKK
jgi:cellulose synthase operon protein C